MNLKRRELIITIIAMVVFLAVALSSNVFADTDTKVTLDALKDKNNVSKDLLEENTNNSGNKITQITTPVNNSNENSNSSTEFNKAGLEDLPVLAFVGCAVVAVFAFKKIKEYKAY